MKSSALGVAAAALILVACSNGPEIQEIVRKSVATGAAPHVKVNNAVGEVRIEGGDTNRVDIEATKDADSLDALKDITIDVRVQGDDVTIETAYAGFLKRGGVRYVIQVPNGASVDVENAAGAVHIGGVDGNVTAHTQTGEIEANVGKVRAGRTIDISATTGAVRLGMSSNSDGTVDARTTVGNVSSDFDAIERSRDNIVGASAKGTLGRGGGKVTLSTTTGEIDINRE
jgi:hypothetical protein